MKAPPSTQSQARVDWRRPQGRRRVLWIGAAAVLVPMALLLWFQYRWLQDLERASTIARQTALENYLGTIAKEVKYTYFSAAERMLNLSATALEPKARGKLGFYLAKRYGPEARRLFLIDFEQPKGQTIWFLDPQEKRLFVPEWSDERAAELGAVQMAIASWRVLRGKGGKVDDTFFVVEERDRDHRLMLKPVIHEDATLAGLVGIILDEPFFRSTVVPAAIAGALPELKDESWQVSVRSSEGDWVIGEPLSAAETKARPSSSMGLVFRDWRIFLSGPAPSPQDWARTHFAFNLSLTFVLALLVTGGIALLLRATSREMHLSEMKNDFVSNVSHELRTPLASIRVFGELMRLGRVRDGEKVREYGSYIEAESRRLTQLIDNILDFSCIESGRKAYEPEVVDLADVVGQMLETWRIRLEHQGFEILYEEEALPLVHADRDAVGQALFNLLDNAVKYSGDSKRIAVRLGRRGQNATVSIQDFGIGISRAEQSLIFDRFHRVGSGLAHDVKGSGLGLSLVRHIASAHGGRVEVTSTPGQGSVFTLYLPLHVAPAADSVSVSPEAGGAAPELSPQ